MPSSAEEEGDFSSRAGASMTMESPRRDNATIEADQEEHEQGRFDWAALAALSIHPLKVGIIEALRYVGRPLSATELAELLADAHYSPELVSYHAGALVKLGVLGVSETDRIRGALRNYYYFSE